MEISSEMLRVPIVQKIHIRVTSGRVLSISSTAHPRWPLRQPSWICFPSIKRTNTWVDWSDFSVAYWGWLEEGSFWSSALQLIQDGHYGRHLGFGFYRLEEKRLGHLIRFFCGILRVNRGRFLSIISSAAHPRWPLRPPCWNWFRSIIWQIPRSTGPIFLWLIGSGWRKVYFDDQCRHSFKMAAMAAILDFVSVNYLTNAWVDWSDLFVAYWGVTGHL
jgi:hypothetical protein